MKTAKIIICIIAMMIACGAGYAQESRTFDFETDTQGWDIPDWSIGQLDSAGKSVTVSQQISNSGKGSLGIETDFPASRWTSATVEYEDDMDLKGYKNISADVYLPKECKSQLMQARIVVTAGSAFFWIEMKDATHLTAGQWATITVPLDVSSSGELRYWQCKDKSQCILANLDQVKKVGIRIEQNINPSNGDIPYKGPVYVDNIVINMEK